MQARSAFDLLGKKHKDKRIEMREQRETDVSEQVIRHVEKVNKLAKEVYEQRKKAIDWKRKVRS